MINRIVVLSKGDWSTPSTRYRFQLLRSAGPWEVVLEPLGWYPDLGSVLPVIDQFAGTSTAVVLQRVFPTEEAIHALKRSFRALLFDYDDAVYASAPMPNEGKAASLARRGGRLLLRGSPSASRRRRPLVRVLREVDVCVAANAVLSGFARRHARSVVEIPTTVQVVDDPPRRPDVPVITWLGVAASLPFLDAIARPLRDVQAATGCRIRIVSSEPWSRDELDLEFVLWSEERSRESLLTSTIGIAPLIDTPWTRGKSASRCIQYGAHGLAAVASPVGVTPQVVLDRETGWLARSKREWGARLHQCLEARDRTDAMGLRARDHVRANFSHEVALEKWTRLLARWDP